MNEREPFAPGRFHSFRPLPARVSERQAARSAGRATIVREDAVKRNLAVIIVEPRTLLREGLSSLLQGSSFGVIASVASPSEISKSALRRASVVIIGVSNEPSENWTWLEQVSSTARGYKILVVAEAAGESGTPDISRIFRWGADGYILNVRSRDVLLRALDLAVLGQKIVVLGQTGGGSKQPGTTDGGFADCPGAQADSDRAAEPLSGREQEILACLAGGKSNKNIAKSCRIAESTVKVHLRSILRKIRARNRAQAAIWAVQKGLGVSGPSPPARDGFEPHAAADLSRAGEEGLS
jgi:two-component system nitrate/nitrite response regulator NarL